MAGGSPWITHWGVKWSLQIYTPGVYRKPVGQTVQAIKIEIIIVITRSDTGIVVRSSYGFWHVVANKS